jgi:predicted DNA-binding antitoxin AbrB/MazE fold protein
MSIKIIECIYEGGILRPLVKVDLEEILDKYAGIVNLGRTVKLQEILTLISYDDSAIVFLT